jgi:hypothetical protein
VNSKPILFSAGMVRAILDGKKSQTRRVIKPHGVSDDVAQWLHTMAKGVDMPCPYGQPGDQLWVRETWKCEELEDGLDGVRFAADGSFCPIQNTMEAAYDWGDARRDNDKWRPSIFMPRWASRITLEVFSVKVERVKSISHEDAVAEGFYHKPDQAWGRLGFSLLWDKINSKRGFGWDVNPWVWVVEFKVLEVRDAK